MNFDFYNPTRLVTGENCIEKNSGLLRQFGGKCMIVTGKTSAKRSGALDDMTAALQREGIAFEVFDEVEQNPLLATVERAGDRARRIGAQFIVGIGGGSPLDAAKAAAVLAANKMDGMELFKCSWPNRALPIVLVGTTAGTGSEFDRSGMATAPDNKKMVFVHDDCFPSLTFGDARYTYSLPMDFTVSTALDALCHSLEGYFSVSANEISDMFATRAAQLVCSGLGQLEEAGEVSRVTPETRRQLYCASVLAGQVIVQCGTAYCHGLSYHLTEEYGVAHGIACAIFLPDFIRRETRLMPEKSARLFAALGCTPQSLWELVERVHRRPSIRMDEREIASIVKRLTGLKNFVRAAPDGYTEGEAAELLRSIFGEK